jgi:hypothetical protein
VCTECTRHCITAEQPAIIGIPWKERTMVGINCELIPTIVLSFQGIPIIAGCSAVMQCRVHSVHTVNTHHCSFFPGYSYNSWMSRHCITAEHPAIIGIPWKERTMVGINCMYRMYKTLYYCRTSSYYRNTLERKNNGGY